MSFQDKNLKFCTGCDKKLLVKRFVSSATNPTAPNLTATNTAAPNYLGPESFGHEPLGHEILRPRITLAPNPSATNGIFPEFKNPEFMELVDRVEVLGRLLELIKFKESFFHGHESFGARMEFSPHLKIGIYGIGG